MQNTNVVWLTTFLICYGEKSYRVLWNGDAFMVKFSIWCPFKMTFTCVFTRGLGEEYLNFTHTAVDAMFGEMHNLSQWRTDVVLNRSHAG